MDNHLYSFITHNNQRKMSWVIQCPKHGKVVTEYRCEGMTQLEKHSKEKQTFNESCYLYEDPNV